jgi:hypothetical protein
VHIPIILLIVEIGCIADHVAIAKGGTERHSPPIQFAGSVHKTGRSPRARGRLTEALATQDDRAAAGRWQISSSRAMMLLPRFQQLIMTSAVDRITLCDGGWR